MLAAGVGVAWGQAASLRPTATPDDGFGLDDGGGLRGSVPAGDFGEALEPVGPLEPVAPEGAPLERRTLPAGQGSALLQVRVGPPPLPRLEAYPTSRRAVPGAAIDTVDALTLPVATPGPTVAALPVPSVARHRAVEPEPFAPIGFPVGSLRVVTYVENSLGYDSNPDQTSAGVKASGFERAEGGFSVLSQWSSNELRSTMSAGYDTFFSNPAANRPDAAGTVDYRVDVTRTLTLDAEGRFGVSTQRPGSPELNVAVQGRPLIASVGTTVGANDVFGRLTLGMHALFDRTTYENGRLPDGTAIPLDTQDFNDYGLALRADYQLNPTFRPFGEVKLDTRVHDTQIDLSGFARDSDGILGRLGTTFAMTPLITGTVSAGYETRSYADRRLRDLRGPVLDAAVAYAVTPLTTLTLLASTSFDETNLAASPGAESRAVSLQVSHALLRNLTLTGTLGYLNTDYIGSSIVENTTSATLKASYAASRSIVLDATYNHQTLHSTDPGSGFTQDVFLVGLRLQH